MEIGRHRGMIASEHTRIGSNSYKKRKNLQIFRLFSENQNYIQDEIKSRLKARN